MNILSNSIICLITGIICSYFVWWFLWRVIVPKISFSEKISKIPQEANAGHYVYRIKYRNSGSRNIVDVNVIIRLSIKGLFKNRKGTWKIIHLETESESKFKPILKPKKKGGNLIVLDINNTPFFSETIVPENIREKHKDKTLTLEDVFEISDRVKLEIVIMGYDEFSGARKVFTSKEYTTSDIGNKIFEANSLELEK